MAELEIPVAESSDDPEVPEKSGSEEKQDEQTETSPEVAPKSGGAARQNLELNLDTQEKGSGQSIHDIYQLTSRRKPNVYQQRRPFSFLRMATVSLSSRQSKDRSSQFTEAPLVRTNSTLPGPANYLPSMKLTRRCAPAFTIAERTKTKSGGGRTSWETPVFASGNDVWRKRTRYDDSGWPSSLDYPHPDNDMIGNTLVTGRNAPAFTMPSVGREKSVFLPADDLPGVSSYDVTRADSLLLLKFPAHRIGERSRTVLWGQFEDTPGPAAYKPRLRHVKTHFPALSMSKAPRITALS